MQAVDETGIKAMKRREERLFMISLVVTSAILWSLLAVPAHAEELVTMQFVQAVTGAGEAADRVKKTYGGQILSVSRQVIDGQVYFLVKTLLPGGRIKVVRVKADSGSGT